MPSIISANVPTTILALSLLREKDPVIVRHSPPWNNRCVKDRPKTLPMPIVCLVVGRDHPNQKPSPTTIFRILGVPPTESQNHIF
jgi:hypothetical protein